MEGNVILKYNIVKTTDKKSDIEVCACVCVCVGRHADRQKEDFLSVDQ